MSIQTDAPAQKDILTRKKLWIIIALSVILGIGIGYLMSKNTAHAPIIIEQRVSD